MTVNREIYGGGLVPEEVAPAYGTTLGLRRFYGTGQKQFPKADYVPEVTMQPHPSTTRGVGLYADGREFQRRSVWGSRWLTLSLPFRNSRDPLVRLARANRKGPIPKRIAGFHPWLNRYGDVVVRGYE